MASHQGRESPSLPPRSDTPREPLLSVVNPPRSSAHQDPSVPGGAALEYPSVTVPPQHSLRIGVETFAHNTGFGHASVRAASPSSPEDGHSPTGFPTYYPVTSPPPPAQIREKYNPREGFDQPGPSTYPRGPQSPALPPDVDIEAQVRNHHTRRSRAISMVEENGQIGDDSDPLSRRLQEKTVKERLEDTLGVANEELEKARFVARWNGWSLNVSIGTQVALGAFTTGIAAATKGRSTSVATSILGGLSTLAASYLARARGSGEPEASISRCKDLEHFKRDCDAFVLDKGHLVGDKYDVMVNGFRRRLEEVLGNTGGAVADKHMDAIKKNGGSPV